MKRGALRPNPDVLLWLGILPLVLAIMAYRTSSEHVRSVEQTLAMDDLIQRLDEVLSTMQDAETGQRGYLLTGQAQYRTRFEARATLSAKLSKLDRPRRVTERQRRRLRSCTG